MRIHLSERAVFQADRMAKVAVATTARLQVDLYGLEPGQKQAVHSHEGQDKVYVVLQGRGRFTLGAEEHTLETGDALVAPAGMPHGLLNDSGSRLLVLVFVTPPPPHA